MARVRKDPSVNAIMEWFEEGNKGTTQQISEALNMPRDIVALGIKRLGRGRFIKMVGRTSTPGSRGKLCAIWSECEVTIKHKPVNVSEVITNQPEFVRIWNRVVA